MNPKNTVTEVTLSIVRNLVEQGIMLTEAEACPCGIGARFSCNAESEPWGFLSVDVTFHPRVANENGTADLMSLLDLDMSISDEERRARIEALDFDPLDILLAMMTAADNDPMDLFGN